MEEGQEDPAEEQGEEEDATDGTPQPPSTPTTPWFHHVRSTIARHTVSSRSQGLLRWATGTVAGAPAPASGAGASSGDKTPANQEQFAFKVKGPKVPQVFGGGWRSCPEVNPYWKDGGGVETRGLRQTRWTSRCV